MMESSQEIKEINFEIFYFEIIFPKIEIKLVDFIILVYRY